MNCRRWWRPSWRRRAGQFLGWIAIAVVGFFAWPSQWGGDTTYVITQCIGGNCPHSGGMVVAKGKKIIARIKAKEGNFTADDAVDFDGEKSKTPLIQIKYPDGIDVTKLFD